MLKSSFRRIRASRANGARSRGPRTPWGKARSSQNAITHGLLAKNVVMAGESQQAFDQMLRQYETRFAPVDGVDEGHIAAMVAAAWRMQRAWAIETRTLDDAVAEQPIGDERGRMAAAFKCLAAGPEFLLLDRYESRLQLRYERALRAFLLVRQAVLPNEPSPMIEHPPEDKSIRDPARLVRR